MTEKITIPPDMKDTKIYAIMEEFKNLNRDEIMRAVSHQLAYMVENKSAREIAKVIAHATAMYSIFDGMLEKIMAINLVNDLIQEIDKVLEDTLPPSSVKDSKDIN